MTWLPWSSRGRAPRERWAASGRAAGASRQGPPRPPARRARRRRGFRRRQGRSDGAAASASPPLPAPRRGRGAVQQVVAELGQPLGDHVDRCRGHDQQAEEAEHEQDRHGPVDGDGRLQRARGQEADDAAGVAHGAGAVGRVGNALGDVDQTRGGEGERAHPDADPRVGRRLVLRRAEQADAQEEQGERHGIGHAAERAGHHGVDDVADHAVEGPPLTGGDSDGQADEEEADAVATVLRLELAGAVPDLAHGAARDVRHTHPGAADRAQRQRQSPALGLAAGCRLAARGGLAVRGARGGTAARRGARGCGRTCRHGPHGTRKPRGTHASHALHDAIGLRNRALRPPSAERGIRRPGSSAISAGQQMQCRSPVPRWYCVWRGLRRRLRTARRRRRPELPAATGRDRPPAISDDGNSRPRAGGP